MEEEREGIYEEFSLADVLSVLRRRKNIIVYFFILSVVVIMGLTLMKPPVYEAKSTILIERESNVLLFKDLFTVETGRWDQKFNSYVRMLHSRSLARRVVKRLKLDASVPSDLPEREKELRFSSLVGALLSHLRVVPIENTRLVEVRYRDTNPKRAARIANAFVDEFIKFTVELKGESAKRASEYLTRQIEKLRKALAEKEKELQKYSQRKDIYYVTDKQSTIIQKFAQLNRAYTQAQINRVNLEAKYRELLAKSFDQFPNVVKNPLITSLKAEYSKLEAQYKQKSAIFKPDYPEMKSLRSRMEALKARIEKETKALGEEELKNARAKYLAALKSEESLRKLVEEQKRQIASANRSGIYYSSLKIEIKNLRELLAHLTKKQKESILSANLEGMRTSSIKVVDRAEAPLYPASPNKKMNLLLSIFVGLFGGVLLALVVESMDTSVKEADEAERLFKLPVLGVTPNMDSLNGHPAEEAPPESLYSSSVFFEMVKTITTSILLSSPQKPPGIIAITSSQPGEGKTTLAYNIAISMAGLGRKTLLMDGDLRRGSLHEVFGYSNERGLSSVLAGRLPIEKAIRPTKYSNLYLLPSGPYPPTPVELLSSEGMKELLEKLSRSFRHIIIDTPPLIGISDPIILSRLAHKTILVIWAGKTSRKDVMNSLSLLKKNGIVPLGFILNRMGFRGSGYKKYAYEYYGYGGYSSTHSTRG